MAVFDDLPGELVTHIFEYLNTATVVENEVFFTQNTARPALCALARVNQFYGSLAKDVLYKRMALWRVDDWGTGDYYNPDTGRSPLFYDTIQKDEILNLIQKLTLHWDGYRFCAVSITDEPERISSLNKPGQKLDSILRQMGQSTSLVELQIFDFQYEYCWPLTQVHGAAFTQLRQLDLWAEYARFIAADLLLKICCLPALERFCSRGGCIVLDGSVKGDITRWDRPWDAKPIPTRDHVPRPEALACLHLKSLNLEGHMGILEGFFRALAPGTPQLRILGSPIFGPGCRNPLTLSSSAECFQPKIIQTLLQPLMSSLEELILVAGSDFGYAGSGEYSLVVDKHDGTSIDLSGFTKLRRLKISSYLVCDGTNTRLNCTPDPEFISNLPATIESFELEIAPHQGILYHQNLLDTLMQESWSSSQEIYNSYNELFWKYNDMPACLTTRLAWLFDMLSRRKSEGLLPRLQNIRIYESYMPRVQNVERIDLVRLYPEIFEKYSDVVMRITIRGPRDHHWRPVHRDPVMAYGVTARSQMLLNYEIPLYDWEWEIAHNRIWWKEYLAKCKEVYGASMTRPEDSTYYKYISKHLALDPSSCKLCHPGGTPDVDTEALTESEA